MVNAKGVASLTNTGEAAVHYRYFIFNIAGEATVSAEEALSQPKM